VTIQMYTNEKDVKVCLFVANVGFCHKSLFFRVTEVCFCLFFKENMVRIWSVFFKIRSVLIIGDTVFGNFFNELWYFLVLAGHILVAFLDSGCLYFSGLFVF